MKNYGDITNGDYVLVDRQPFQVIDTTFIQMQQRRPTMELKISNIQLPIKADYKVIEAHPGVKGDTASGGNKQVIIEGGAKVAVPLFINQGDIIRINTETGLYAERMEKGK